MSSPLVDELRRQHTQLRVLVDHCDAILAQAEDDRADAADVATAVRAVAAALGAHHEFEEAHLELVGEDPRHRLHHSHLLVGLDDPSIRTLAAVLRDLREHLSREDAVLAGL
jgi:hypothetical protein